MLRRINNSIFSEKIFILLSSFIVFVIIFFQFQWYKYHNPFGVYSQYDLYAVTNLMSNEIIVPLGLLLLMFFVRNDFSTMYILQYKSSNKIWGYNILKAFVFSLYYSTLTAISCGISGKIQLPDYYNWDKENSFFRAATSKVLENMDFIKLLSVYIFSITCMVFLFSIIILIIYWISNSFVFGFMVAFVLCIIDEFKAMGFSVFRDKSGVQYLALKNWFNVVEQIVVPLTVIIILIIIGYLISNKKEYLKQSKNNGGTYE